MRNLFNRHTAILLLLVSLFVYGQTIEHGLPFFRNFTAKEYNANNQNYDVACDGYGTVFVANFEGLVYYDGATWRKIYTPGISRVTCLAKGNDGRIWVGGYNVFGYLIADKQGNLKIKAIMSDEHSNGHQEVNLIKVSGSSVMFHTTQNRTYKVLPGDKLELLKTGGNELFSKAADSISSLKLPDGVRVNYSNDSGMRFTLSDNSVSKIGEKEGLISNAINFITYDHSNTIWGATARGVFSTEVTTPYSRLTEAEGLDGEVHCIGEIGKILYIGTQKGLYSVSGGKVHSIPGIDLACWALVRDNSGRLVAPTSNGLFIVSANGTRQLTTANTLSACIDPSTHDILAGETGGIYRVSESGRHEKISNLEKVTKISCDGRRILATTIYGSQWQIAASNSDKTPDKCLRKEADANSPKVNYKDCFGRQWTTDGDGMNLKLTSSKASDSKFQLWSYPLSQQQVNALFVCSDGNIVAGGESGIVIIDAHAANTIKIPAKEKPYIRSVTVMEDSVMWGGYSENGLTPVSDVKNLDLSEDCYNLMVTFSTRNNSIICPTKYRYRLNHRQWSAWSNEPFATFKDLPYGDLTLEIQSQDLFGRQSETSVVSGYVHFPFYLRWWAAIFYVFVLVGIVYLFFRARTMRLKMEKKKLEGIVEERTSELRDTLEDLKRTQDDLVRMERTATAGKLTQGLIDRILNPINYINNFSKLTANLAKDLKEDIEDEKDNMSEDNYDDCDDILSMMTQNLEKIQEHGVNTTRTLRSMESILNAHVGAMIDQDIIPLCRQVVKVIEDYHKDTIKECGIKVTCQVPSDPVMVKIDAESINRVLIALLSNSVYAVAKKYRQTPYNAEVILKLDRSESGQIVITTHDNGIGMEDTIKEKVFDPFFTTKPTGEASGVGLYLVRELVNDHNATIIVESQKDEYCEFIITFNK